MLMQFAAGKVANLNRSNLKVGFGLLSDQNSCASLQLGPEDAKMLLSLLGWWSGFGFVDEGIYFFCKLWPAVRKKKYLRFTLKEAEYLTIPLRKGKELILA